jgi:hypothetical protein
VHACWRVYTGEARVTHSHTHSSAGGEDEDRGYRGDGPSRRAPSEAKVEGSISGRGSGDVKQSTQYIKDKLNRTFKR